MIRIGDRVRLKDAHRRLIWNKDQVTRESRQFLEVQREGRVMGCCVGSPSPENDDGDLPIHAPYEWSMPDDPRVAVGVQGDDDYWFATLDELEPA